MISSLRKPRLVVLVNGESLAGVEEVSVTCVGGFHAAEFQVNAAINMDREHDISWWDHQEDILVDIKISLDGGTSFSSIMLGSVDRITVDIIQGWVSVSGRDLSSRLIDSRLQESFSNQSTQDLVNLFATRRGLVPVVSSTSDFVGRYYRDDHHQIGVGQLAHARTEWDLLADLAQQEGCDLYMSGQELHFETPVMSEPFFARWDRQAGGANVTDLSLEKYPPLARGVHVQVRSWQSKQGKSFTCQAGPEGGMSAYVLRPNITENSAQSLAVQLQADLAAQQRRIRFSMPGESTMSPRGYVRIDGNVGDWSGLYRIQSVERRLDMANGFRQRIIAQYSV